MLPPLDGLFDEFVDRVFLRISAYGLHRLHGEGELGSARIEDCWSFSNAADSVVADGSIRDAVEQIVRGCVGRSCGNDDLVGVDCSRPRIDNCRSELGLSRAGRAPGDHQAVVPCERHCLLLSIIEACRFSCSFQLDFDRGLHMPDWTDPCICPSVVVGVAVLEVHVASVGRRVMVVLRVGIS